MQKQKTIIQKLRFKKECWEDKMVNMNVTPSKHYMYELMKQKSKLNQTIILDNSSM